VTSLRYGALCVVTALAIATPASAGVLQGPARFCGYAPIIDLLEGESVTTLAGGIHRGLFRWDGPLGSMVVTGIGWASKPPGRVALERTAAGQVRFKQRREKGKFVVAIWNREHGAAYFRSERPLNKAQIAAIDRVSLFNEGENPKGCKLRTIFVWE
jgi:hypothetical protein